MEQIRSVLFSPLQSLYSRFDAERKKLDLPCPGGWENIHKEIKGTFPQLHLIDGAKIELSSALSSSFQVSHNFTWGSASYPPTYNFMAIRHTGKTLMTGQIDHDGNLSARANYNWIPTPMPEQPPAPTDPNQPQLPPIPPASNRLSSTSKLQFQLTKQAAHNTIQLEHDFVGSDFAVNVKAINPNPIDKPVSFDGKKKGSGRSTQTGIFSASYLQSISKSWAVGAEYQYQRLTPDNEESGLTYAVRWAPPPETLLPPPGFPEGMPSPYYPINPKDFTQVLATTYQPSTGLLHSSYWRKLNQRLEVGAEVQALITPGSDGRREAIANFGFKLDTVSSIIRGSVDSHGHISAFIDEKFTPGLALQLSGEIDYAKGSGGQGRVGIGFVFEG
ncbi:translocase of outer mitochondrial membrane [Nowakowskiella sp. JEL0407]|nr:translocase of outer mitochondrial membrane [Nowakowskiella sp. JEL0407]